MDERGLLRVTRTDSSKVVLAGAVVGNDSLFGNTVTEPPQRLAIAVADIAIVERGRLSHRPFWKTVGVSYLFYLTFLMLVMARAVAGW